MAKLEKRIVINAPPEKIFEYINAPTNLPEVWPSMIEAKDVQPLDNGGNRFRWVYKMAGMRFEGTSEDVECVANERVISETKGGIESTIVWTFQPQAGGTEVIFGGEYIVPIPLLGKLAEAFIVRQNEQEADLLVEITKGTVKTI